MSEEDLSVDYELAQRQCAQLHSDGKASLEASIAITEAWVDQQTAERWGVEPGAVYFRQAYREFLETFVDHMKGNISELNEFTARLQVAIRDFQNNEEELQRAVGEIVAEIKEKSADGKYLPVDEPVRMYGPPLPSNMRME